MLGAAAELACGSGPSDAPTTAEPQPLPIEQGGVDARELPYEPCAPGRAVATFSIRLESDYTSVDGSVLDGVSPAQVPTELAREGDCRLLELVANRCTPGCRASDEVCAMDQTCVPAPVPHDVGIVSVTGLVIPLAMRANAVTHSYTNPALPALPHPGFAPGADLRLGTSGGDYAPFVLRGWGVSALQLEPAPIRVDAGAPVAVAWRAPEDPGPARLHVKLAINHHGSTSASIECDFADAGSAEIPAALVDGLIARGTSGFPTLELSRRTAGSVAIEPGCAQLLVSSDVVSSVEVDGIISCHTSAECPSGQSCLPVELFCQ